MRMPKEWLEELREKVAEFDTEKLRECYRDDKFPRSENTKNKNMRYRWDLCHQVNKDAGYELLNKYYAAGMTDAHIDTALRNIVKPL